MFKFLFGCAVTSVAFYVFANHPELVQRGIAAARQQIAVASHNVSAVVSGDKSTKAFEPEDRPTTINEARVREQVHSMKGMTSDDLWGVMDDSDYDRRAAAGQILLARAGIPASLEGVKVVNRKYLKSGLKEYLMTGFSYLGLLALQGIPDESVVRLAQGYVERHPQDVVCDSALWALGELGSEDMVPYFFSVIGNPSKYGSAARERSFCCLVQCGRFSPNRRLEMVPSFIEIYGEAPDIQTRDWSMQALSHCAPGVRARSIDDWKNWWDSHRGMASNL